MGVLNFFFSNMLQIKVHKRMDLSSYSLEERGLGFNINSLSTLTNQYDFKHVIEERRIMVKSLKKITIL